MRAKLPTRTKSERLFHGNEPKNRRAMNGIESEQYSPAERRLGSGRTAA